MTTISLKKEMVGRSFHYELSATGHAGYAPVGQDIVCSAVSILFFTLANALSDSGVGELDVKLDPGDSTITCICSCNDIEVESLFKFAMVGLELLEEQYPDNVEIFDN